MESKTRRLNGFEVLDCSGTGGAVNTRRTLLAIPIAIFAATPLLVACGGGPVGGLGPVGDASVQDSTTSGGVCVSGRQIACACLGGGPTGVQTCNADGHGYGTCGCPVNDGSATGGSDAGSTSADANPTSGDAGSAVDSGGHGACTPLTSADTCGANGCECPTPGCCGAACQSAHSDGLGQSFYDCVAQGTHTQAQAKAACAAFTGDAGSCTMSSACCDDSLGLCITVQSTDAVCGMISAQCHCWSYVGDDSGTVQTPDAGCAEVCPASGDPGWN
jgi:hypothetical protein